MTDWAERQERLRQENIKRRRKRRREDFLVNVLAGGAIVGGIIGFIILITLIGALPVFLAWNLGVVGVSHALHGHIHLISFVTALGASLCIGVISRIFHRGSSLTVKR